MSAIKHKSYSTNTTYVPLKIANSSAENKKFHQSVNLSNKSILQAIVPKSHLTSHDLKHNNSSHEKTSIPIDQL